MPPIQGLKVFGGDELNALFEVETSKSRKYKFYVYFLVFI